MMQVFLEEQRAVVQTIGHLFTTEIEIGGIPIALGVLLP